METKSVTTEVMVAPLNSGVAAKQGAAMTLIEKHAEALRDVALKGEVLRRASHRSIQCLGSSEMAYMAWKQAVAVATSLYSEIRPK